MVSTFGPNIRGISPYSDSLATAFNSNNSIQLHRSDYHQAFPKFLLPKNTDYSASNSYATINYLKPSTWDITKDQSYDLVHIQYLSLIHI